MTSLHKHPSPLIRSPPFHEQQDSPSTLQMSSKNAARSFDTAGRRSRTELPKVEVQLGGPSAVANLTSSLMRYERNDTTGPVRLIICGLNKTTQSVSLGHRWQRKIGTDRDRVKLKVRATLLYSALLHITLNSRPYLAPDQLAQISSRSTRHP
jgi:hypothetical protein